MKSGPQLLQYLDAFRAVRALCLGDVMLDRFVYGRVNRVSEEAPIPILRASRGETMLGGAANVARNLETLGGQVSLVGLIGDDAAGTEIRRLADAIEFDAVVDASRPSTVKTRYVAAQQQLLRVDDERTADAEAASEEALSAGFERALESADVVILSDYAKGCLTDQVLGRAIASARAAGKPIVCDPKRQDLGAYAGITVLKPNRRELALATGRPCDSDEQVAAAGASLLAEIDIEAVLVSRSEQGLSLIMREAQALHLPAMAREVFDVSGAGDTVVASLAMALGAGAGLADATMIANMAGSLAVAKAGTAAVTRGELAKALADSNVQRPESKLGSRREALERVRRWRAAGLKVGFTNGCFDLLHPGHIALLQEARSYCDRLIVAINDDASVKRLKGPERPLQDAAARAMILAAMTAVDLVLVYPEDTPVPLLELLRPDLLVKGGDYDRSGVVGGDLVAGYGGEVHLARLLDGNSSSGLISKISESDGGG